MLTTELVVQQRHKRVSYTCSARSAAQERAQSQHSDSAAYGNGRHWAEENGPAGEGRDQVPREPDSNDEEDESEFEGLESAAEIRAWQKLNNPNRRNTTITPEHRKKMLAGRKSRLGSTHSEATKRRIANEMRKLQESVEHRRRISEALLGKPRICSICGQEGHNKRSCPQAEGNAQEAQEGTGEGQNKTKKLKKLSYAELTALREKRRKERKDRPKSKFKGLSWSMDRSLWHVQVWVKEKSTTKSVGYFDDEEVAAREYDKAVLKLRGAGAELNFPEDVKLSLPEETQQPKTALGKEEIVPFPVGTKAIISSAVTSILAAWKSGVRRQRIEYVLPFERENETGGLRQEFIAVRDLVEQTLLQLKKAPQFAGRLSAQWLDRSDFVGAWQSETMAAVVLCTADCLTQLRNMDGGDLGDRLVLVVNPQWQIGGQVISDFGIGKARRDAEDFVNSFQDVFFMQRRRILGDNIRMFKSFDSKWQVHYVWPNGKGEVLVGRQDEAPSYEQLLALLRRVPGSKSSQSWVDRVLRPDWSPGASSADFVFEQTNNLRPSKPGEEVVVGASKKEGQALVQKPDEKQSSLPPVSISPAESPQQANPVESPESLAAAASQDAAALNELKRDPESSEADFKLESTGETVPVGKTEGNRVPDRFTGDRPPRDLRLEALMSVPQWPRQLYSNAFGRESDDARQELGQAKKAAPSPRKRTTQRTKQARNSELSSGDEEVESWVARDAGDIANAKTDGIDKD